MILGQSLPRCPTGKMFFAWSRRDQELQNGMGEETCVYLGNECKDRAPKMGLPESLIQDSSRNENLQSAMKVRDKERADQPWIEKVLTERWGGLQVIAHDEIFDAHLLPALIAGEKDGLATFRVQQMNQSKVAELITLDALMPQ
jgi:hypothetical protein